MDNLLFIASKVLYFVVQPSSAALLLLLAGLAVAWRRPDARFGWRLAAVGVVAVLVGGFSPLANLVLVPLETRFQRPSLENMGPVTGLIILGGFEDTTGERGRGLGLNEAAERLTEAARVARLLPKLKVAG
jgi:uncharacterized SAM-binding protein YcdF (DUF218 family)